MKYVTLFIALLIIIASSATITKEKDVLREEMRSLLIDSTRYTNATAQSLEKASSPQEASETIIDHARIMHLLKLRNDMMHLRYPELSEKSCLNKLEKDLKKEMDAYIAAEKRFTQAVTKLSEKFHGSSVIQKALNDKLAIIENGQTTEEDAIAENQETENPEDNTAKKE